MAINPLISLQSKVPDISATFSNALTNIGKFDDIKQRREQAPIRNRLLEAQTASTEAVVPSSISQLNVEDLNRLRSVATGARSIVPDLQAGNNTRVMSTLQSRRAELVNRGISTEDTDEALRLIQSDPNELMRVSLQAIAADDRLTPKARTGQASAKTEIMASGATIQALPNEDVIVRNPLGEVVTGQERLDVLQEARDLKRKQQEESAERTVSTARKVKAVEKASATAGKAFDMVDKIRLNIENLKQVTPLIGNGASTGPISAFFPSFKAETIKLEQLQKRLGLDVVGATTFGALSKGELDLAKAVALPLNLRGDKLIEWVNDSIKAKEKLASYYEEQAIFLDDGKTQADWLKFKRAELKGIMGDANESDIRKTMRDNNMTRPEVIAELKRRRQSGGQ